MNKHKHDGIIDLQKDKIISKSQLDNALNKVTIPLKILLLEDALRAWENNAEFTRFGLCDYFHRKHGIMYTEMDMLFIEVHNKRTTKNAYPWTEHYWFNTREERIDALKLTIEELKNK